MPVSKAVLGIVGTTAVAGAIAVGAVVSSSSSPKPKATTTTAATAKPTTTTTAAAAATATTVLLPDPSCQQEPSRKSIDDHAKFNLTFVNNTAQTVQTLWLNFDGKRVFYRQIPAGTAYVQATYITHPWIVATLDGTCLTLYDTDGKQDTVTVPVGSTGPSTPTTEPNAGAAIKGTVTAGVQATDAQKFAPQAVDVRLNDLVEWTNPGTVGHNVTWDDPALAPANDLHLNTGDVWRVRFTQRGSFSYTCTIHNGMTGTIVVH